MSPWIILTEDQRQLQVYKIIKYTCNISSICIKSLSKYPVLWKHFLEGGNEAFTNFFYVIDCSWSAGWKTCFCLQNLSALGHINYVSRDVECMPSYPQ